MKRLRSGRMPSKAEVHFNGRSVSGATRAVRVGVHARVGTVGPIGVEGYTVYFYLAQKSGIGDVNERHSSEILFPAGMGWINHIWKMMRSAQVFC